ncbi:hypothetical protein [Pseudomonas aeruginosa]|uniref:hypothetical protein n=1 Tax=Pseudomonas aeruginosa TaxID=287 RepID=UPI00051F25CA|nr:hypothetical protein [Pseudomonas aeruginosa]MDS9418440.1 hypothetical protein [Pseudomonas aeruginosa]MDS9434522.1 hypothetical protein [Pseudomonas aeruginosa]MDS9501627.1 hypothetical protein [Pseudomonas aeruginosa]MDS9566463.1 hypothetical protein [Pseudomonas aeruginosa]MDS9579594.1 hypothetical protein [Pseudomonas aeruginosa]
MSDLPPRPAFWPYLPGYALLLLSVLLCASGSYRFVTPMALADGVDLVYLSQGLALLPLGTGLVGLLAGFLLHVRGRWLGALLALLPATLFCAWNLYNYAAHGDEALSPSFAQYTQALLGLLLLGGCSAARNSSACCAINPTRLVFQWWKRNFRIARRVPPGYPN